MLEDDDVVVSAVVAADEADLTGAGEEGVIEAVSAEGEGEGFHGARVGERGVRVKAEPARGVSILARRGRGGGRSGGLWASRATCSGRSRPTRRRRR